ncbi:MAG: hypothetical protein ABI203_10270 [Mucilaginibacter sp.]
MNKLVLFVLLVFCTTKVFASADKTDSLKQQIAVAPLNEIDSLQISIQTAANDSLKGQLYTQIARQYLKYDSISSKKTIFSHQNEAIKNTLSAIHIYSKYNDTTGLRNSFDDLTKAYHAQHKYSQAKWFILQSNTLSRDKNDNPNIIVSLIELASIKADIKDYTLAMRDLNEALMISSKNHYTQLESQVQLNYAMLYNSMKNPTKAAIALKRHQAIEDSIKRDEIAKITAKLAIEDSELMAKKKLYTIISKRFYRINSSKRLVSL